MMKNRNYDSKLKCTSLLLGLSIWDTSDTVSHFFTVVYAVIDKTTHDSTQMSYRQEHTCYKANYIKMYTAHVTAMT